MTATIVVAKVIVIATLEHLRLVGVGQNLPSGRKSNMAAAMVGVMNRCGSIVAVLKLGIDITVVARRDKVLGTNVLNNFPKTRNRRTDISFAHFFLQGAGIENLVPVNFIGANQSLDFAFAKDGTPVSAIFLAFVEPVLSKNNSLAKIECCKSRHGWKLDFWCLSQENRGLVNVLWVGTLDLVHFNALFRSHRFGFCFVEEFYSRVRHAFKPHLRQKSNGWLFIVNARIQIIFEWHLRRNKKRWKTKKEVE